MNSLEPLSPRLGHAVQTALTNRHHIQPSSPLGVVRFLRPRPVYIYVFSHVEWRWSRRREKRVVPERFHLKMESPSALAVDRPRPECKTMSHIQPFAC
jgi:hypothetical protein